MGDRRVYVDDNGKQYYVENGIKYYINNKNNVTKMLIPIIVAVIGMIGTIGAAIIGSIPVGSPPKPTGCVLFNSALINSIYNCDGDLSINIAVEATLTAITQSQTPVQPTLNVIDDTVGMTSIPDSNIITPTPQLRPSSTPITSIVSTCNLALPFTEDFSSRHTENCWDTQGIWQYATEANGNGIYQGLSDYGYAVIGSPDWHNYAFQYDIKPISLTKNTNAYQQGDVFTYFRWNDTVNYYDLSLYFQRNWTTLGYMQNNNWVGLSDKTISLDRNNWTRVRIEARTDSIQVYINNQMLYNANNSVFRNGSTGFGIAPGQQMAFDNVSITPLN